MMGAHRLADQDLDRFSVVGGFCNAQLHQFEQQVKPSLLRISPAQQQLLPQESPAPLTQPTQRGWILDSELTKETFARRLLTNFCIFPQLVQTTHLRRRQLYGNPRIVGGVINYICGPNSCVFLIYAKNFYFHQYSGKILFFSHQCAIHHLDLEYNSVCCSKTQKYGRQMGWRVGGIIRAFTI